MNPLDLAPSPHHAARSTTSALPDAPQVPVRRRPVRAAGARVLRAAAAVLLDLSTRVEPRPVPAPTRPRSA